MFSRYVNPRTGDHAVDDQGRWRRDDTLATRVYLLLATERGSFPGDPTVGSRLHLLRRGKLTANIHRVAEDYAREALEDLVRDGSLTDLVVTAQRVPEAGFLRLDVGATDTTGTERRFSHRVRVAS
jgi:phage gp46-like protein